MPQMSLRCLWAGDKKCANVFGYGERTKLRSLLFFRIMKKRVLGHIEVSALGPGCMGLSHAYGAASVRTALILDTGGTEFHWRHSDMFHAETAEIT